jgi:pyrroline-5-carboxylate reductase
VIAVNPYQLESVTDVMKGKIAPDTIVISIASGTPVSVIEEQLGAGTKIARVLPNTMIEVRTGYSAVVLNDNITETDRAKIEEFVGALGQIMYIEEDMFQTFSAFAGPGPMYAYKLIEAMINAGVQAGFSREDSRKLVIRNIKGAAMTLEETGDHPAERVDRMTSPAGITMVLSLGIIPHVCARTGHRLTITRQIASDWASIVPRTAVPT